jgi:hypothetical protein
MMEQDQQPSKLAKIVQIFNDLTLFCVYFPQTTYEYIIFIIIVLRDIGAYSSFSCTVPGVVCVSLHLFLTTTDYCGEKNQCSERQNELLKVMHHLQVTNAAFNTGSI